jgi:hypothetical protein
MNTASVLVRAVTLASAAPAVAFSLVLPLLDKYLTAGNFAFYFACAFIVSACHVLLLGLPVALALRNAGRLTVLSLAVAGLVVGALPTAAVLLVQWATEPSLNLACQADPLCEAAAASSKVGASAILTVIAAGGLGCLAAMCFYVSSRKVWPSSHSA